MNHWIGIGVLIHVPYTATNPPHQFELGLGKEDGEEIPLGDTEPTPEAPEGKIMKLGAEFNMGRPPTLLAGDEQIIPFSVNINGPKFEEAGAYSFRIAIDGTEVKRLPFRVALAIPQIRPVSA